MDPLTIVIVDDDEDIRSALAEVLVAEGYSIRVAADGAAALETIHQLGAEHCLVLLDMMMPVLGGEEVLASLRTEGLLPALPVIIVSAITPPFAVSTGARLCLHKPIDIDVLLRVLERFCGESRRVVDTSCSRLRTTADPSRVQEIILPRAEPVGRRRA